MSLTIKICFAAFLMAFLALSDAECPYNPYNKIWSTCASPCGPTKCIPDDIMCTSVCVNGWDCPPNQSMDPYGYCVPDYYCGLWSRSAKRAELSEPLNQEVAEPLDKEPILP